ncbi:hypothetical protein EEB14_56405 [Rhodococcus sp. WS4]|nr:hypothetical protein EEB14_56405 [Rhodococcus sp. WS4]
MNAGPWASPGRAGPWPVSAKSSPSAATTFPRCPRTTHRAGPCPIRSSLRLSPRSTASRPPADAISASLSNCSSTPVADQPRSATCRGTASTKTGTANTRKNNRVGRRLPIGDATAELLIEHKQRVRDRFPDTPLAELALLPRATRNRAGTQPIHDDTLASAHRRWVDDLEALHRPDGSEFDKSAVFLYAYRHSFAQRHADAGTPVDVLRELMGHRSIAMTQGYYSVTATRTRKAVDALAAVQFNGRGEHVWSQARLLLESEHQRLAVGQVAVPFGICTEPSNVQAGGGSCPFRFRCLGCGHFRSDPSYLPELQDYLDTLLRDRERVRAATELDDWARDEAVPSEAEITRLRQLIRRVQHDLDALTEDERGQIEEAVRVVRRTRQTVHLGLPTTGPQTLETHR